MKRLLWLLLMPACASAQVTLQMLAKGEFAITNHGQATVEVRLLQSTNRVHWTPVHQPLMWFSVAPRRPVWTYHQNATNAVNFYRVEVR